MNYLTLVINELTKLFSIILAAAVVAAGTAKISFDMLSNTLPGFIEYELPRWSNVIKLTDIDTSSVGALMTMALQFFNSVNTFSE